MAKEKPSFTAFLIPKVLPALAASKKYFDLVTKQQVEISRLMANECAKNDLSIKLLHNLIGNGAAIWLIDNFGIKGSPVHYAARKNYIRKQLQAVAGEVTQVTMIGAGFDTLCLEYSHLHPQMEFFELDQQATQRIKLDALARMPGITTSNMNFVAADLSKKNLKEALRPTKFDKKQKSFFVIEGVLPYLERKDVEKLFSDISSLSAKGSYIVFGSMSEMEGNARTKTADMVLAKKKEKYKFAAPVSEIKKIVERAGFTLQETKLYHELQQNIETERRLKILKSERGEHYYFAKK